MLQLINTSSYVDDCAMWRSWGGGLEGFLGDHGLDGVEAYLGDDWDDAQLSARHICGVHLRFWPAWLDFWRGDEAEVLRQFGSWENARLYYGADTPTGWLAVWRRNLAQAVAAGARYVVLHVAHVRQEETGHWRFSASDEEVVTATLELVRLLVQELPASVALLFENLWWPGLRLTQPRMAALLFDGLGRANAGIMLDTGHLMNTCQELRNEQEAVDYVLRTVDALGIYASRVRGLHLHASLSGEYVRHSRRRDMKVSDVETLWKHVSAIDQHQPFGSKEAARLVQRIGPAYTVHEFIYSSLEEVSKKVTCQQAALAAGGLGELPWKQRGWSARMRASGAGVR